MGSFTDEQVRLRMAMPTPELTWKLLTRADARALHDEHHVAIAEVTFDEIDYVIFPKVVNTTVAGEEVTLFTACLTRDGGPIVPLGVRAPTWTDFLVQFGVRWNEECDSRRYQRAGWNINQKRMQMAGITEYHLEDDEEAPPLPLTSVPSIEQRIHDLATAYHTWETNNTAETGADYVRTRTYFKVWIGYAWYLANLATKRSSLEVLLNAFQAGTREITGFTNYMDWVVQPLEWWTDAGHDSWRTAAASKSQVIQLLTDRNLFHVNSSGAPTEARRGAVDAGDWTTYQTTQYTAAKDWTAPPPANGNGQ